jgi:ABC-type nitrate/sulfonate/bicarbonate transport system substrate-binding protein
MNQRVLSTRSLHSASNNRKSRIQNLKWPALVALLLALSVSAGARAGQKDLQKLTVGYTPISGAALPFFIAVEERIFQKHGFEVSPVFMGGSPLINSAILAGEFPIGYTGGGAVISSRLSGSDLVAIASPLPVLTIDGWSKPEIKSISDLRGKRVGVTRFGASSYFSALSMLEAGSSPMR